jgi:hypothetical protein
MPGPEVVKSEKDAVADPALPTADRRTAPSTTLAVALVFAGLVAAVLRIVWNPGARSYLEYVPIGAVFAGFLCDRLLSGWPTNARGAMWDGVVLTLALMRVFVPPLPFVSGHTLFATYAVLTGRRWPVRAIALPVLAEVVYVKVFASGGWQSMLGGLAVALVAAAARGREG